MTIDPKKFLITDTLYANQLSEQVARTTNELSRLEKLLIAGCVDRQILIEFRDVVNRVRRTGWAVQQRLEGVAASDSKAAHESLIAERIRTLKEMIKALLMDIPEIDPVALENLTSFLASALEQFLQLAGIHPNTLVEASEAARQQPGPNQDDLQDGARHPATVSRLAPGQ